MTSEVLYSNPEGAGPPQGLYAHVGTSTGGRLHFIAGQLAVAADGSVAGVGDFETQFATVFGNLGDVLKWLSCDYNKVIRFTTYLTSADYIPAFMKCRAALFPTLFKGPLYPPNTLLVISRLVKPEFMIEVDSIVQVD